MNEETVVVMLFLTVRVFLVGGILLVFPRIARKGLVFGTYVGETTAEGDAARNLLRRWDRGCVLVMALSLLVGYGIAFAGWPVAGNLIATAFLVLAFVGLYLWMYPKARHLAPPAAARQAEVAAAPLSVVESKGDGLAKLALASCVLTGLATVAYATVSYESLPARIPTLGNLLGATENTIARSLLAVMFLPSLNLVVSPFFALIALLIARAKRSLRGGSGGCSAEAQAAFRITASRCFSWSALLICLLLTVVSVQWIRVALSRTDSLGPAFMWLCVGIVLFMGGYLFRILKAYGQGGSRLEEGSADAPLTGALADNARWIGGLFYIDRDDPSLMVESRFGIGYTFNLGNRISVLILVIFAALTMGLIALAVVGGVF